MTAEAELARTIKRLYSRARAAANVGDFGKAVELIEEIVRLQGPDTSRGVYVLQVRAYRATGQLEAAEAVYARAVASFPNDVRLLSQGAYNAKSLNDVPLTILRLEQQLAVAGAEASEKTHRRLVEALRLAERWGEVDSRASEGLARYPGSTALHRARTAAAAAQPSAALEAITAAHKAVQLRLATPPAEAPEAPEASPVDKPGTSNWMTTLDSPAPRRHPYQNLQPRMFWNRAVENRFALDIDDWYRKKFSISGLAIATAGSCFAQHIGRALRQNGYDFVDVEPAPSFLKQRSWVDFGYGMYSARFGNVYTARQLLQLAQRALGQFEPAETAWSKDGGYVDPYRPTIEPEPFESEDELRALQSHHLRAVIEMFEKAQVFVFTLGLTEAWESRLDGAVFPVAPGVSGGHWDPTRYRLRNLDYVEILSDMEAFIALVRGINPTMKFILTVSPVPLMATATDDHVVVATSHSKAVLRAVAGQLAARHDYADYFPSFEIISAPVMRGQFFNPDLRTVSSYGVEHVMRQFFAQHIPTPRDLPPNSADEADADDDEAVACDEELLREFGGSAL